MTPDALGLSVGCNDSGKRDVIVAYAATMQIDLADLAPHLERVILDSCIAHAHDDVSAAIQAGISVEQMAHDRVTLNAIDGLPLIITGQTTQGRYYFSRPIEGWPIPGHRRYR